MKLPFRVAALIAVGSVAGPAALRAQYDRDSGGRRDRPARAISLVAGTSNYKLSGTGTAFAAAIRLGIPVGRLFLVEPGIGFFRYRTLFGQSLKYVLPEIGLQFQPLEGPVRPYVGVGAGFSEYLTGPGASPGTVHAAAGIRAWLTRSYGIQAEVRLRGLDPFSGQRMTDITLGLSKR